MAPKKKKPEIKKKKALEHKHRMKRKDVRRCGSKQSMTPDFTCPMRIEIFLTWDNKWYLHQDSSLQHSFIPNLTTPQPHSERRIYKKQSQTGKFQVLFSLFL
jgi:hypothetical protein